MKSKRTFTLAILTLLFAILPGRSNAQMFWNQACSFAGNSGSYISVPNSGTLNIQGSFTIEAWVRPTGGATRGVISKGGALGTSMRYAIRINGSRAAIITNGALRLVSKASTVIPNLQWTHVAGTYNFISGTFSIYINGQLDTSSVIAGAIPAANTDSLFVGISGNSTPFTGQLDEVRVWFRELSGGEVAEYFRSSLSDTTGIYSGLALSMTFQDTDSQTNDFNTGDMTGNNNNGNARNVAALDQSHNPSNSLSYNEAAFFPGSAGSYISGKDTASLDASTALTVECWVYLTNSNPCVFLSKGASSPAYQIAWNGSQLTARLNNTNLNIGTTALSQRRWTHLALTYSNTGSYKFFVNGDQKFSGFQALGNVNNNSDSLFIGGGPGSLAEMSGMLDEVRITRDYAKSEFELLNGMFTSVEAGNDPEGTRTDIAYNFDGNLLDNTRDGGPRLKFIGSSKFGHSSVSANPPSPVLRNETETLSKGFYINPSMKSVPASGTLGLTLDTLLVNQSLTINDLNLFVAMDHESLSQIEITLYGPNGDSVKVFDKNIPAGSNRGIVTLFSDEADSALVSGRYAVFSPVLRPHAGLNAVFSGDNSKGKWIIKIADVSSGLTGRLSGWGLQFNNSTERKINANISALIQGFYNPSTNLMTPDTISVVFRSNVPPFSLLDSSRVLFDQNGLGLVSFDDSLFGKQMYVQLLHRNSLETWSVSPGTLFRKFNNTYSFFIESASFENNVVQVDDSPLLFAIYGGDVNRDGTIDVSDLGLIDNDVFGFSAGYIVTDLTGDNNVDISDLLIADNNASKFVSVLRP